MYWWKKDSEPAKGFGDLLHRSKVPITLADLRLHDAPLIGVNEAFCRVTGYSADRVLGRNCRFLQPPGGPGPVRHRLRNFIYNDNLAEAKFVVPNVKADGTAFLNLLYMSKLKIGNKNVYILGSQFEFTLHGDNGLEVYEAVLREDIRSLRTLGGELGVVMLRTYEQLASSHSIIANLRLMHGKGGIG